MTPEETATAPKPARWDWVLVGLIVVSLGLRAVLIARGGQVFWPDESRYNTSVETVRALRAGHAEVATGLLLANADHLGFKVVMLLPAWAQLAWDWSLPAVAWFGSGLFSLLSIAMVYALARRLGAERTEARWATLLMAASTSMFYWSRHLVPYDMALFWCLVCLHVGLHPAPRWFHSLGAGVLGFVGFVVYNGAWLPAGFALVVHVLRGWPAIREMLRRAAFGLAGLAGSLGLLACATHGGGLDLFEAYRDFAGTVIQGDFADGAFILGRYLWASEHGLLLVWIAGAGVFLAALAARKKNLARPGVWFAGMIVVGGVLVLFSNVFHFFVVYGRLVRQLVPFCALLGGWALARLTAGRGVAAGLAAAGIVALAAGNLAAPLAQTFPQQFSRRMDAAVLERFRSLPDPSLAPAMRDRLRVLNLGFIWPAPVREELPPHELLLRAPHPLQYEPYLYEGFDRRQRQAFHDIDVSMCLILIKD